MQLSTALPSLATFAYLQLLDYLSTVAFLLLGVKEGNPLINWVLSISPNPVQGLLFVKVLALGIALVCLKLDRLALLARINVFFALVITWNLLALILAAASLPRL